MPRSYPLFIKKVVEAMDQQGYSARQLAFEVGVDPSYISRLLAGERNPPSDQIIGRIAVALKVDLEDLLLSAGRLVLMRSGQSLTEEELAMLKKFLADLRRRRQKGRRR